jgi:hypothetical protein
MPILKQSALTYRHVKLVPDLPSGPSQYERLGTVHSGFDPLETIKHDLKEVESTIADLKEEASQPGEAQKYAKAMLRQLTRRRADLLELKKKWMQPA